MTKIIDFFKNSKGNLILLIIALVLINLVSYSAYKRVDITEDKIYSISKISQETVANLEQPLSIQVFFSSDLPSPYNDTYTYLSDLLNEYRQNANEKFSYTFMDMDVKENQEIAKEYGINQVALPNIKTNEISEKLAWISLAIHYEDKTEILNGIKSTNGLEYNITTTISKMISTTDFLAGLKDKINLTFYATDNVGTFYNIDGYKDLNAAVKNACASVNKKYKNRLTYKHISKFDFNTARQTAIKYGIQGFPFSHTEAGSFGLVLEYNDSFKVVPFGVIPAPNRNSFSLTPNYIVYGLDNLEESIIQTLKSLVSKQNMVGYTIGHSEAFLNDEETGGAMLKYTLEDSYKFNELDLSSEEIPSTLSSIIINGPKDPIPQEELYKIDQFLLKGGNVMIFLDSYFESIPQENGISNYEVLKTNLDGMLEKYGIRINKDYVLDEECIKVPDVMNNQIPLYYMPYLHKENFSQEHMITKGMGEVFFAQAASMDVSQAMKKSDLKTTVLAKTSPKSWLMDNYITTYPPYIIKPEQTDASAFSEKNVAVILEGNFESAFDGKDKDSHISKSIQPGKLLVVSSSKMTGTIMFSIYASLLDSSSFGPANVNFIKNIFDYMNGAEEVCAMRNKGVSKSNLEDTEEASADFARYFNEIGLAIIVAITGIIMMFLIYRKKNNIRRQYNPDDQRVQMSLGEKLSASLTEKINKFKNKENR